MAKTKLVRIDVRVHGAAKLYALKKGTSLQRLTERALALLINRKPTSRGKKVGVDLVK